MLDSSEYRERIARPFTPPVITFSELNSAVPLKFRTKSLPWAMCFVLRDAMFSVVFYRLANCIDAFESPTIRLGLWGLYWFWQSIAWTGFWTLGAPYSLSMLSRVYEIYYSSRSWTREYFR
jgi:hypothetical protein